MTRIKGGARVRLSLYSGIGSKKLPSRKDQIAASAWDSSFSDSQLSLVENGTSLPSTGYYNSNSGSGVTFGPGATPSDPESLPGSTAGSIRSVRTESTATKNCVSRYGIQDLVGNVWEWLSDQLGPCSAITHSCIGQSSSIDSTNSDFATLRWDGLVAPGGGTTNITEWDFAAMSFNSGNFLVPLGMSLLTNADPSFDSIPIGNGSGQWNPNLFHGDHFWLYTDNGGASRSAFAGGPWYYGQYSGRYALALNNPAALTSSALGLRCNINLD